MTQPLSASNERSLLGATSAEWLGVARENGMSAAAALDAYRLFYRDAALPAATSAALRGVFAMHVHPVICEHREHGTIKFTQDLGEGLESESVIIPAHSTTGRIRHTLCVSSQIGCAMGCTFCETAQMGFLRHLSAAEIIGQWFAARHHYGAVIDNIVFMGMGEPMENLDAVLQAIRILTDRNGPAVAASRITVSTVGRIEGIRRYTAFAQQIGFRDLRLAVSVNAPNDAIRSQLMPVNRAEPLDALFAALRTWPRRLLIEYVLIPGVNDQREHAQELCDRLHALNCTLNVIPYNPRRDSPWKAPDEGDVARFVAAVAERGVLVKRRATRGRSVMAACGQLGNETIRRRSRVGLSIAGSENG